MEIAVAGGTGTLGSAVCAALESRGHDVRVLSRSSPTHRVDLSTGEGLREAVRGCDAVVDASNGMGKAAQAVLVEGTHRLLEVERAAGVGHHVGVSIVGCDKIPGFGYYRAKVAQEQAIRAGSMPWTLVRATQFHDLLDGAFAATARLGLRPSLAVPVQPVAVTDAAAAIADVVAGLDAADRVSTGRTVEVVGPEVESLRDLGRTWHEVTGKGRVPLRLPVWGGSMRALRDGALVDDDAPDVRGTTTFESWLKTTYA